VSFGDGQKKRVLVFLSMMASFEIASVFCELYNGKLEMHEMFLTITWVWLQSMLSHGC
jgi:hypothetical protein